MHPRNFLDRDPQGGEFDAEGEVGSFACGDIIKIWIKIDKETDKIKDIKWRTWGCATAIASASIFTEMVKENGGMSLEDALKNKTARHRGKTWRSARSQIPLLHFSRQSFQKSRGGI